MKCTRYQDALKMAKEIVVRLPKAFEKVTWKGGVSHSDGVNELRTSIYERLKYLNRQSSTPMNGKRRRLALYDERCCCDIVIEKEIVLRVNDVIRGTLFFILFYYVYGYNYPAEKSSTLEFLQRMILDINPAKEHKRSKKGSKSNKDAKASTLMDNIVSFIG